MIAVVVLHIRVKQNDPMIFSHLARREIIIVINGVAVDSEAKLFQLIGTGDCLCLFSRLVQRGQEHRG